MERDGDGDRDWPTDCTRCFGICCVALAHQPRAGFPAVKASHTACRHLGDDFRCRIFAHLEREGFTVCRAYDCYGAGPVVAARMRAEWGPWTPEMVASAHGHLTGFRELARMRMLIVALRRHGGAEADALAGRLDPIADDFRRTGRIEVDAETAQFMRWHETLISAILRPLTDQSDQDANDGGNDDERS